MFFARFSLWLQGQLAAYIGANTAAIATALEPVAVTLSTLYVMWWGYLHLTGRIEEPVMEGVKRILLLVLVLGVGIHLWLYNAVIVELFYDAPAQLAAVVAGAADPVETIDTIWDRGGTVAGLLWSKGGFLHGDFGFYIAAAFVWTVMGLACVYAMFLLALSRIALAVLLALGPLFILLLLFDGTKRFFEGWLAQLANYALIGVLTVLLAALLLQIVQSYATQTAELGADIVTVDALNMLLVTVLVFLVFRQVMPIAASLAGGVSLASFSLLSRTIAKGAGAVTNTGYQVGRGLIDTGSHNSDSLRRRLGQGLAGLSRAPWRGESARPLQRKST